MTNDPTPSHHEVTPTSGGTGITRRDVLALLAAFGVPTTVLAKTPPAQDPTKILPKSYRVAFENNFVRVLEYNNRPGMGPCGAGLHYHPRHIDIVLTPIRARITENGKVHAVNPNAGDVLWFEAETHEVENVDKTATRVYMVEIKDASWKPSTG